MHCNKAYSQQSIGHQSFESLCCQVSDRTKMFHAKCFDITNSGAIEKPRHHGVCPQKSEILRIGQLRLVPLAIDEAQKPQGLLAPRPELMPGPRLYRN